MAKIETCLVSSFSGDSFECLSDLDYRPLFLFFFHDTATTEIYTLSLHDALPIFGPLAGDGHQVDERDAPVFRFVFRFERSEEHTSELQSHHDLVCRLLLEKK